MFTGIVETLGKASRVDRSNGSVRVELEIPGAPDLALGESVAVDGVCLTVSALIPDRSHAVFDLSPETVALTHLGRLNPGQDVHIERALRMGDRLSGHWVQGHVDGLAEVVSNQPDGDTMRLRIELKPALARYCVQKGSITIDGVSLTINRIETGSTVIIDLQIIPHTLKCTKLGRLRSGDSVNVEVDVLAKYALGELQHA